MTQAYRYRVACGLVICGKAGSSIPVTQRAWVPAVSEVSCPKSSAGLYLGGRRWGQERQDYCSCIWPPRDRSKGLRLNLLWESSTLHISFCLLWVGLVSPILQMRKQTQRIAKCTQLESEFNSGPSEYKVKSGDGISSLRTGVSPEPRLSPQSHWELWRASVFSIRLETL